MPGGGPIGGMGDVGCVGGAGVCCWEAGGLVRIDLGTMGICACEVGDIDLLEGFGDDPCESCCEL
jgi:hypothetical protein